MPKRQKRPSRLLASELEILEVLWRAGPVTIVEAQRELSGAPGYTTVQTRLNRLVRKKIVRRSPQRPSKYSAIIQPDEVAMSDLDMLLEKVSWGRVVPLVAHLMKDRNLTDEEVAELKQLIEETEKQSTYKSVKRGNSHE